MQKLDMRGGVDVLVGTPGRLKDLLSNRTLRLSQLQWLIFDECDAMLVPELTADVRALLTSHEMPVPSQRTTVLCASNIVDVMQLQAVAADVMRPSYVMIRGGIGSQAVAGTRLGQCVA